MSRVLLLVALFAAAAPAPAESDKAEATKTVPEALKRAAATQKGLSPDKIQDITIHFEGHAWTESKGQHSIRIEYSYRADGSFRIKTAVKISSKDNSERGVLGKNGYWELTRKGKRIDLKKGNRHDREVIEQIEQERRNFEAFRNFLFLKSLQGDGISYVEHPQLVLLAGDRPHEIRKILGEEAERSKLRYRRIDVRMPKQPVLRLFIREQDGTVRKAILYDREAPHEIAFVFYFGLFEPNRNVEGALLPIVVSFHKAVPTARDDKTVLAWGRVKRIAVNTGLKDDFFRPAGR
ncbi:MAG: hypothetical protein O7C98_04270 [Planctomycetota bacterium]|nr:hypothetical protein [Planctomycetota bacterium]